MAHTKIVLAFTTGLAAVILMLAAAPEAEARDDRKYFRQIEREARIRATEDRRLEQTRLRRAQQDRERAVIRNLRASQRRQREAPSDRLSRRFSPPIEPLGQVERRFENQADVARRRTAPPRNRERPNSYDELSRRFR